MVQSFTWEMPVYNQVCQSKDSPAVAEAPTSTAAGKPNTTVDRVQTGCWLNLISEETEKGRKQGRIGMGWSQVRGCWIHNPLPDLDIPPAALNCYTRSRTGISHGGHCGSWHIQIGPYPSHSLSDPQRCIGLAAIVLLNCNSQCSSCIWLDCKTDVWILHTNTPKNSCSTFETGAPVNDSFWNVLFYIQTMPKGDSFKCIWEILNGNWFYLFEILLFHCSTSCNKVASIIKYKTHDVPSRNKRINNTQ